MLSGRDASILNAASSFEKVYCNGVSEGMDRSASDTGPLGVLC